MKYNPFTKLAPLLKCRNCNSQPVDPKSGLCKSCEIKQLKCQQEKDK